MGNSTQSDFSTGLSADQLASSLKAAQQEQDAKKEYSVLAEEMEKTRKEVVAVNDSVKETTASVNTLTAEITQTGKVISNGYKVIVPPETIEHQMQVLGSFVKNFDSLIGKKIEEVRTIMKEDNKDFFRELNRNKQQILNATDKVVISRLTAWWIGVNFFILIMYFAFNFYISYCKFPAEKFVELCHHFLGLIVIVNSLFFLYYRWDKGNERERRY